ncbi:amidohydrolase [Cercophora scortea]|uniref:Amidohydrolase n=1 Tax=Cercophora scortea TaxID=314031 RepID=A0AAE0I6Z4_9PEZI|nr:amidohydrolase [Cercophora scortea]
MKSASMHLPLIFSVVFPGLAAASSILFSGGTVIGFDSATESLDVIRNGSVLVTNDRIAGVYSGAPTAPLPKGTEIIDITDKIITTGFVDTHKHGWQTAFKTLGSNTSLVEYFGRYGQFVTGTIFTADDVYIGQLAGIYEALNGGVTTILDHAHHTWGTAQSNAGLKASIDSGARVFWSYAFAPLTNVNYSLEQQFSDFRDIAKAASFKGTPTSLGIAYDSFGPNPNVSEVNVVMGLAKEFNVSVITTHSLQGPWGFDNSPEDVNNLGYLNISIPIVFSHASFLTNAGASLLRATNQYISITAESEMHYGHTHPHSHLIQDQASLGIDTHFTFSSDILTQARLWLQVTRRQLYAEVLARWQVPSNNPMSVDQAFLLATRHGGLALRRNDIGVLAVGAKADLVVWDGTSPALLGWNDPVAAIILHASVGDIEHVLVDGKFKKRDFKIVERSYPDVRKRFLKSAKRIQGVLVNTITPLPKAGDPWPYNELEIGETNTVDTLRGKGKGYGELFLDAGK